MSKFLKKVAKLYLLLLTYQREDYGVAEQKGVCRKEFNITLGS